MNYSNYHSSQNSIVSAQKCELFTYLKDKTIDKRKIIIESKSLSTKK
jgi:hypothetical protein